MPTPSIVRATNAALSLLFIVFSVIDLSSASRLGQVRSGQNVAVLLWVPVVACWLVGLLPWLVYWRRRDLSWIARVSLVPAAYIVVTLIFVIVVSTGRVGPGPLAWESWETWHIALLWPLLPYADANCALGMAQYVCH